MQVKIKIPNQREPISIQVEVLPRVGDFISLDLQDGPKVPKRLCVVKVTHMITKTTQTIQIDCVYHVDDDD